MDDVRFLLDHEEDVSEIDKLVSLRLIDRNNTGKLVVPFAAISALRGKVAMADDIISACSLVFTILKDQFRNDPNKDVFLSELALHTSLSEAQVRIALSYLLLISLWANRSPDFSSPQAFVRASTGILRYKTFNDVVDQLDKWNIPTPIPYLSSGREKQQKFGILDSPALLESDLTRAAGILGRALLYIDLDDFKSLNTRYSEVVVDRDILRVVHEALRQFTENIGFSYGEGGDEFVILLPNSTIEMGKAFGAEIGRRIQSLSFWGETNNVHISASIGIAHEPAGTDTKDLKEHANHAMRQAKREGKDRIHVWSDNSQ